MKIPVTWSKDRIIFVALIAGAIAAGVWIYVLTRQLRSARHAAKVQTVVVARDNVLNADSLRSATERRVQDSAAAVIDQYSRQLKTLRNEISILQTQNAALRDAYNSINVERPDF